MRKGETANRSGYRIRQTRTLQRFFRGDHFCQYPVRLIPTDPLFTRLIGMNPTVAVFTQRQECRQIIPGQYARSIIPMVNLRNRTPATKARWRNEFCGPHQMESLTQ